MWLHVPHSTSVPVTEASSSPSDLTGIELFVTLSGTPTQRPLSWRGWKRRTWIKHLSGTISQPLTATRGVTAWISSLPVCPASRSQSQAAGKASTIRDTFGRTHEESSARFDLGSCSWRTFPTLFEPDGLPVSSPTLPASGSMLNGECWQRPPLVPLTAANGSGLWGTPVARDDQKSMAAHLAMKRRMGRKTGSSLTVQAKGWPTPRASEGFRGTDPQRPGRQGGQSLLQAINGRQAPTTPSGGLAGLALNPRFVEALMGLPNGWLTPSTSAATASYPNAQAKHSDSYVNDSRGE